jgi:hypothetical protein
MRGPKALRLNEDRLYRNEKSVSVWDLCLGFWCFPQLRAVYQNNTHVQKRYTKMKQASWKPLVTQVSNSPVLLAATCVAAPSFSASILDRSASSVPSQAFSRVPAAKKPQVFAKSLELVPLL